jgi:arsenical-resistance protein 2
MASSATASAGNDPEQPWYASYPEASSRPTPISCAELLGLLKEGNEGVKLVLVDLRRTDFEVCQRRICASNAFSFFSQGGTINGSINLPAQSLFPTIPSLYSIFHAAGVRRVVWYCGMFSSIAFPERLQL